MSDSTSSQGDAICVGNGPGSERPEASRSPAPSQEPLSGVQIQKLNVEIEKLKLEIEGLRSWGNKIGRYIPLLTAFVAAGAFIFGIHKFQSEQDSQHAKTIEQQEKDRTSREVDQRIRFQEQIRFDLDQVLQFAHDEKQTIARVSFLLDDLKANLDSRDGGGKRVSDTFPDYERTATKSLVTLILHDCDFIKGPRDVSFAETVLDHWEDYSSYLKKKKNLRKLNFILYMHIRALRHLHDKNPGYFEDMEYNKKQDTYYVSAKYENQEINPRRYRHFLGVAQSFKKHIGLLDGEKRTEAVQVREKNLRDFQAALCNRAVSTNILGTYFEDQECEDYRRH